MISNEIRSPFNRQPYHQPSYQQHSPYPPRQPVQEDTLKSEQIQIERKTFNLTLKENPRGRFLRITEDVGGRRDTIIIPAPGLEGGRAGEYLTDYLGRKAWERMQQVEAVGGFKKAK